MRRVALLTLLIASALPLFARGQSVHLDYSERKLANGLKVVVLEDHSTPIVAVQVWYHVGSNNEDPNRQGFAHMFEHMMFRGTDRLGTKEHFELLRKTGGDCNAYTSFDQTVYVNKVPSNQLALVLWLESERMAFLKIDNESFYTERAVVEEERRMGINAPYGTLLERVLPTIFKDSTYRWATIGQIPHLRKATIDELMKFWETYYVPNNATLVIVGDVKADDAQKLAEKYFSWIPASDSAVPTIETEPKQNEMRQVEVAEPKGPLTLAAYAYRTVPMSHADAPALEVLASVLGGGQSSRLWMDMVKNNELTIAAGAGSLNLENAGIFAAGGALKPFGAEKEDVFKHLDAQIEKVRTEPISQEELDKAKHELLKGEVTGAMTVESKAQLLGQYATLYHDLSRVNKRAEEVEKVTIADVQRVAQTYLVKERMTKVTIEHSMGEMLKNLIKGKDDEGAAPATKPAENRVAQRHGPKSHAVRPADFPTTAPVEPLLSEFPKVPRDEKTLANGLKVVVVPNTEVPLVTMTLGIKFGAFAEDPKHAGSAAMAAEMITQGTENYSSDDLSRELESHAISLGGSVSMDAGTVTASCLKDETDRAVRLLAEVVRRPTFPEKDFKRQKEQTLGALLVSTATPSYLADREFRARVFAGHPYARPAGGEPGDVRKLTPAELKAWWTKFVRPDDSVLYIAGDITAAQGFALAEKYLGDWKIDAPAPTVELPPVPQRSPTMIYLVNKPGLVQSQIRVGQIGMTRDDPDYQPARVLTQVFGGSFGSRLNETLRVKKGLTYGVGGGFSAQRFAGTFQISTFSKTDTTTDAVKGIMDEVQNLQSVPPTDEEMATSKGFLVGSFAGDRETPQATINDLWLIESCGLPEDYLQKSLASVSNASVEDVVRVALRQVDPTKLTVVVVGDAKRVKADLERLAPTLVIEPPKGELSSTQPAK
jgi:zinc protease